MPTSPRSMRSPMFSALELPLALLAVLALSGLPRPAPAAEQKFKEIFGWVEEAILVPYDRKMKAKLDTGALTSSLDARDIEPFERDGDDWVAFTVPRRDAEDVQDLRLERELFRDVTIEGHEEDSERPVVLIDLCLGQFVHRIQVSLTDRSEFNYPLLIGRRLLEEIALVDASATFLRDPSCGAAENEE